MASKSSVGLPPRKAYHRACAQGDGSFLRIAVHPLAPGMIMSPRRDTGQRTSILYVLSYGGGLVGGDRIELDIRVEVNTKLVALTQVMNIIRT